MIIGFALTVIVKSYFARYEYLGLLAVGFIVGVMVHNGALSGMWHAAVSGAFGTIVSAILTILIFTFNETNITRLFGGLIGFTISGTSSLIVVVEYIIYYAIVMGISGAVGGVLVSTRKN